MSLIESKTRCFGLLLIVNDIGDARETLPSPLWLLGQTMIRSGQTDSKMYDVWTFRCTHGNAHIRVDTYKKKAYLDALLGAIAREEDPVHIAALIKTRLYSTQEGKLTWDRGYLKILANHIPGGKQTRVNKGMWLLSKTGEVNLTKFKQDKKAAIAKFLAKSVEGGEVVEIRDVSSTSVMINSCYDMPKTRYGLGAYACLGLGSNLIRVSSGELIANPAYIQSPVDIKLSCPSRGICTSMQ